jgi:hypothetical protein
MPSHSTICSFVFSALLTSAFVPTTGDAALASAGAPAVQLAVQSAINGVRGQIFADGAQVALPAPASTPASVPASTRPSQPTFTPEALAQLLKAVAERGVDREISAPFASALKLNGGQTWPDRQYSVNGTDNLVHAFIISRGADQDLILYVRDSKTVHVFRCTREGKSLAAMDYDLQSKAITPRTADEAQTDLDAEVGFWVRSSANLPAGS